ncbi:MAG TPA: hypothetical protein VJM13_11690 [Sphingopyxis sp.]|nr:hypothetical protein [Sphingopyxis sp.]
MMAILGGCSGATASAPVDHPRSYLLSVVDLPLTVDESLESFSIATWGVEFKAVCKIPGGWRIKAGNSTTPDGTLEGEGSQGATWFNERNPSELREIVLVTLVAEVQREDVSHGPDATFKGVATISTDDGERTAPLSYRNILLRPAPRCP